MKTRIFLILAIATSSLYTSQQISLGEISRFNKFMNSVNSPKGTAITYGEIEGDAYINKHFSSAKIENAKSEVPARYNMFTDEIEILGNGDVFILPKSSQYPKISFINPSMTLVFAENGNEPAGYYQELVGGKNLLLKKMRVEFRDAVRAVNTYTRDYPARFENSKPAYFIKTESKLIKISKDEKELIKNFPEKKSEIQSFIKSDKIKLNKEVDLIKLTNFINQL